MIDKKLKCWRKIQNILNSYGYSYMDMLEYMHLIDVSRMKQEFDDYIKKLNELEEDDEENSRSYRRTWIKANSSHKGKHKGYWRKIKIK